LQWIRQNTNAHIHADLIFGLPGDDINSFAESFNQLYVLQPHEIQVGILKRLKGSPIIRHTSEHQLVFNPSPPFNVLSTATVSYSLMQQMNRFARYWDMLGNSGRFRDTLPTLINDDPFARFSVISNAVFERTGQTHKISLLRLFDLLHDIAIDQFSVNSVELVMLLQQDFDRSGLKSWPVCLRGNLSNKASKPSISHQKRRNARQNRH